MSLAPVLCCFNTMTAIYLEKLNLGITTFAIIFDIFKLCIIPWGATSYSLEFLAIFTFIFLAINLVLVFFFFMLRLKNMVNDYNYKTCYFTCCIMIFFSLLNFFFELLLMFNTLADLYHYTGTYYALTNEVVVSDGEFYVAFFTIIPSAIFWFVIFMLWVSECMRVAVKTYGTYEDYMNDDIEIIIVNKGGNKKPNVPVKKVDENHNQVKPGENAPVKQSNNPPVVITYA